MRKSSVSKQSKHSSCSAAVERRALRARRRANFLCQRATSGAPSAMRSRGRARLGCDLGVRHDARHEALLLRFGGVEDAAFEQDLERDVGAGEPHQRRHLRHTPSPGPRFLIGAPKRLDSPQMRRSHSAAISRPPPTQMPWICATSGWRHVGERARRRVHRVAVLDRLRLVGALVANSAMSLPGENAFSPAPRSMMQRSAVVGGRARRSRAPRSRHMPRVSALSFSGRLSTTVAIGAVALDLDRFAHRWRSPVEEARRGPCRSTGT